MLETTLISNYSGELMKYYIIVTLLSISLLFTTPTFSAGSTFIDSDTNLEWQLTDSYHFKLDNAISYCANQPSAKNNWRLPNINELISLIDFKGSPVQDGPIETVLFIKPALLDYTSIITTTYYWSSTTNKYSSDSEGQNLVLTINFAFGETTRRPRDNTGSGLVKKRLRTRCVRNYKN